jgi:hypothetical protein
MPKLSVALSALCALAFAASCRPHPQVMSQEEARRYVAAQDVAQRDSFINLPQCALPALGDTTTWIRPDGAVLALPPDFHRDSVQPGYMHGGESWSGGTWHYQVVNGHWGWTSFGPGDRCQLRLEGREAMYERSVRKGRQFETVWLPDNKRITIGSSIFAADGPKGTTPLLARAIQTHPDFGK